MFDFYKDTLLDFIADQRIQEGQAASQGTSASSSPSLEPHFCSHQIGSRSLSCQQEFFDEFAKRHSFDPLQPENWYNVSRSAILLAKVSHYLPSSTHNQYLPLSLMDVL